MRPKHFDIKHWTIIDRSVLVRWDTAGEMVFGLITGNAIILDGVIRADIVVIDANVSYQKTAGIRWAKEGDGVREFRFVTEPADVTEYRLEREKALQAEAEAELKKRKEAIAEGIIANARKPSDTGAGRGGAFDDDPVVAKPAANQRKTAAKASRL